jgi:hypothetical protein
MKTNPMTVEKGNIHSYNNPAFAADDDS